MRLPTFALYMKRVANCILMLFLSGCSLSHQYRFTVVRRTGRPQFAGLKRLIDALPTLSDVDLEIGNKSSP
jgi:hypothetical protein